METPDDKITMKLFFKHIQNKTETQKIMQGTEMMQENFMRKQGAAILHWCLLQLIHCLAHCMNNYFLYLKWHKQNLVIPKDSRNEGEKRRRYYTPNLSSLETWFLGSLRSSWVKRMLSFTFSGEINSAATLIHDCKRWTHQKSPTWAYKWWKEKNGSMCYWTFLILQKIAIKKDDRMTWNKEMN